MLSGIYCFIILLVCLELLLPATHVIHWFLSFTTNAIIGFSYSLPRFHPWVL